MMKTTLILALCAAWLAGCQSPPAREASTPPAAAIPATGTAATRADAAAVLPRYHWRLQEASNPQGERVSALFIAGAEPLQLDFQDGRIAVSRLCNTMTGTYTLSADTLRIGPLASTMMACRDEARTLQARFASVLLNAHDYRLDLAQAGTAAPLLTLRRADGHTLVFAGAPTPDTRFGGPPQTAFLEVASRTGPCPPSAAGSQCLQVREIQFDSQGIRLGTPGKFQPFTADIEGYEHRQGLRNVLRVKRYPVTPPDAGGPSAAYVLDLVVESAQEP